MKNKTALLYGVLLLPLVVKCDFPKPKGDPIAAVQGLITRLLGKQHVSSFVYEVIEDASNSHDVFEFDSSDGKPLLRGNNGVAFGSALNHYLKYYCNCSVSWGRDGTGDQLNLPSKLPLPDRLRMVSPVLYR